MPRKARRRNGPVDYVGGIVAPFAGAIGATQGAAEKATRRAPKLKNPKRRNPEGAAAAGFEEFHGHPPKEFVTVQRKVHFHRFLSGAGALRMLRVRPERQKSIVKLDHFGGALLAFNERKNQLFVEGGDQRIDLKVFGIDPARAHELETLGKVIKIGYHTDKSHLGDEGGKATYEHKFRTVNEGGQHVTVRVLRYPDLIYRVLDQQLEFSGGSYEIIAEGINR